MEQAPPPIPPPARGNWWTRNWKWFVPTGCLTILALFLAFIALIAIIVFSAMKSSDVYKDALAKAKAEPAVIEALGSPIQDGMFVSGNTKVDGGSGEANLAIPISGPKGKGTLYVVAIKSVGFWNYSSLVVEVAQTKQRIDLLHEHD
jgi:Cytochrome oxidase complex assembly protein 1